VPGALQVLRRQTEARRRGALLPNEQLPVAARLQGLHAVSGITFHNGGQAMTRIHEEHELYGTVNAPDPDSDGWNYAATPQDGTDSRKLVTLEQDGMVWIGIRAWSSQHRCWVNNGEPTRETVVAWKDLPRPAEHRWVNGLLT
jgi:hypothetical protein